MKRLLLSLSTFSLLAVASTSYAKTDLSASATPAVSGDYIESRSLSIYAGACHYGGEAVTEGKEAILAWNVKSGSWDGQNLGGLKVVAVVNGPENLATQPNGHRTIVYVDESASPQQRGALVSLLRKNYDGFLGEVTDVKSAPVRFQQKDRTYRVQVPGVAYLAADKYPCHKCVMPHQVWYSPFLPTQKAEVARALRTEFKADVPSFTQWSKEEANSAYIGEFTL